MSLSIKAKFILTVFSVFLIFITFLGWFTIHHEKKALKTELKGRANSLVNNLAIVNRNQMQ